MTTMEPSRMPAREQVAWLWKMVLSESPCKSM